MSRTGTRQAASRKDRTRSSLVSRAVRKGTGPSWVPRQTGHNQVRSRTQTRQAASRKDQTRSSLVRRTVRKRAGPSQTRPREDEAGPSQTGPDQTGQSRDPKGDGTKSDRTRTRQTVSRDDRTRPSPVSREVRRGTGPSWDPSQTGRDQARTSVAQVRTDRTRQGEGPLQPRRSAALIPPK